MNPKPFKKIRILMEIVFHESLFSEILLATDDWFFTGLCFHGKFLPQKNGRSNHSGYGHKHQ